MLFLGLWGGGTVAAIKLVQIQPLLEQDRVHRGDPCGLFNSGAHTVLSKEM